MPPARPRLLVIGAGGFVGSWVMRVAAASCDCIAGARRPPTKGQSVHIDVCDPSSVQAAFAEARPDVVLLTAAMADIDRCEVEQDLADQINHQGPARVARSCRETSARLIFTSTDAVFDGSLSAYPESAAPTPVNFYGVTKARAETAIRDLLPEVTIVRFSLVLGRSLVAGSNSYVDKLAATLAAGKAVQAPTFEYRNPIDVTTLAGLLTGLAKQSAPGIFHAGSSDKMSRYELAQRLATALGADPTLIQPQHAPPAGRAPRGTDDFLICERLPQLLAFQVPTCQQVIERAVHGTS